MKLGPYIKSITTEHGFVAFPNPTVPSITRVPTLNLCYVIAVRAHIAMLAILCCFKTVNSLISLLNERPYNYLLIRAFVVILRTIFDVCSHMNFRSGVPDFIIVRHLMWHSVVRFFQRCT